MSEDPREEREERSIVARKGRDLRSWVAGASLTTAGLTLAFSVAIGAGLGLLMDRWLKTNWIVIAGLLFGTVAGFKKLFEVVALASREEERAEAERRREREQDTQ
jgi:F0F1-type ATP synthase assembly protein I